MLWGVKRFAFTRKQTASNKTPRQINRNLIFNLTGILLAEMYASRAGLGQLISSWGENFMLRELLAGILLISAVAILFNETVRWLEARLEHWRA